MLEAHNIDIQVKTQLHLNLTTFKLSTEQNHQKSKYLRACFFLHGLNYKGNIFLESG